MTDRLVYVRRFYGIKMSVETTTVLRISRQTSPVQIMLCQKRLDIVEYFRSMITNDARSISGINPLHSELNPTRKNQHAELFCGVIKFCPCFSKKTWVSVYTQIWHSTTFMIDSVLRHCADNKRRGLSMLPNVGHQILHVKIAGITRSSPYSLR